MFIQCFKLDDLYIYFTLKYLMHVIFLYFQQKQLSNMTMKVSKQVTSLLLFTISVERALGSR